MNRADGCRSRVDRRTGFPLRAGYVMAVDELDIHMHGRPISYVLSYLARGTVAGQEPPDLAQAKESLYRDRCLKNPRGFVLSRAARDLLERRTWSDVPRTIATSSETMSSNLAKAPDLMETARGDGAQLIVFSKLRLRFLPQHAGEKIEPHVRSRRMAILGLFCAARKRWGVAASPNVYRRSDTAYQDLGRLAEASEVLRPRPCEVIRIRHEPSGSFA